MVEEIDSARPIGIQAVPTFVFPGRYGVNGAQPSAAFSRILRDVRNGLGGSGPDEALSG